MRWMSRPRSSLRSDLAALAALCLALAGCGDDLGGLSGDDDDDPSDDGTTVDAGADPDPDAAATPDAAPGGPDAGADAGPDGGVPVIEGDQAGGSPTVVALVGDLAYVGVGPRLAIWRIPPEGGPIEPVGRSEALPGVVAGVAVAGDLAFVSERVDLFGRIHVIDVSDPTAPVETSSFSLVEQGAGSSTPGGLALDGDRLFVADGEQGVVEVDVADPAAPVVLRSSPHPSVDVHVVGDRLYYEAQSFLGGAVVGVLRLSDLVDLGEVGFPAASGVAISPDHFVVAAGTDGIHVVNMADPAAPALRLRVIDPAGGPFSRAVAVSAGLAWVPAEDGLYVIDLVPPDITSSGPFDLDVTGANAAAAAAGQLAVVDARGQLVAFDLDVRDAEPPDARRATTISLCADCVGLDVEGDRLVAADFAGGLRVARADDLSLVGRSIAPAGFLVYEDVTVVGDVAYVADWSFGLRIYDLSIESAPALVGQVPTAGFPSAVAVDPAGPAGRVYLGESTNGGNLRVIDAADPPTAVELGSVATSQTRGLAVRDGLAYVADGSLDLAGGLRIYDVSDPAAIPVVGYHGEGCSEAIDVALSGDLAIVACSFDGFHVVDVSDPAAPALLAVVPPGGNAAWDGGAALGTDHGVLVVDLDSPRAPTVIAELPTAWTVRALGTPGDGRLYAASGPGGVYRWALADRARAASALPR